MAKKHSWIADTCIKCGLIREKKITKILMAIVNHPPWNVYKYEQGFIYYDGYKMIDKRPDCKQIK